MRGLVVPDGELGDLGLEVLTGGEVAAAQESFLVRTPDHCPVMFHASLTHPDLQEITIRWRGSFGYADAWAGEGDDSDERIPPCRIEYPGDDGDRGFTVYDPAAESYTDAILHTGHYTGHPSDAYDTAAIIHLADYQK